MTTYVVKRVLSTIPVILIVATIVFVIVQLMPGTIIDYMMGGEEMEAPSVSLVKQAEDLGLNLPVHVQYWNWLTRLARGDLGMSLLTREPVLDRILQRLPATVILMGSGLILSILISVAVGVISALKQYSVLDHTVTAMSFTAISIPSFFMALGAIYIFAVHLGWVPVGGMGPVGVRSPSLAIRFRHLIMPVIIVALPRAAAFARYVRSGMLDVISEQYIQTARSKGLAERVVVLRHALPNALIPLITMIGLSIPVIFGGSVVIERVFSWPGIGMMTINALTQRDFTVIVGLNMFFSLFVLAGNLLADIAYAVVDPRIRYD